VFFCDAMSAHARRRELTSTARFCAACEHISRVAAALFRVLSLCATSVCGTTLTAGRNAVRLWRALAMLYLALRMRGLMGVRCGDYRRCGRLHHAAARRRTSVSAYAESALATSMLSRLRGAEQHRAARARAARLAGTCGFPGRGLETWRRTLRDFSWLVPPIISLAKKQALTCTLLLCSILHSMDAVLLTFSDDVWRGTRTDMVCMLFVPHAMLRCADCFFLHSLQAVSLALAGLLRRTIVNARLKKTVSALCSVVGFARRAAGALERGSLSPVARL